MKSETITLPRELTDNMAEAIAFEANCCGGIASDIWEALVASAPVDDGWIACSDRLPEINDSQYIIHCRDGITRVGFLNNGDWFFNWHYHDSDFVTHWRPLPSPPPMKKDPE